MYGSPKGNIGILLSKYYLTYVKSINKKTQSYVVTMCRQVSNAFNSTFYVIIKDNLHILSMVVDTPTSFIP